MSDPRDTENHPALLAFHQQQKMIDEANRTVKQERERVRAEHAEQMAVLGRIEALLQRLVALEEAKGSEK